MGQNVKLNSALVKKPLVGFQVTTMLQKCWQMKTLSDWNC